MGRSGLKYYSFELMRGGLQVYGFDIMNPCRHFSRSLCCPLKLVLPFLKRKTI